MKKNMCLIKFKNVFIIAMLIMMTTVTAYAEHEESYENVENTDMIKYPVAIVDVHYGSWLNVRKTPNGELTYNYLYPQYDVIILDQQDGWALVTTKNQLEAGREPFGWASMDYLVIYRYYLVTTK